MTDRILAATTTGRRHTELREYPFPEIPPDAGMLTIEAAGVCGSDWHAYNADGPVRIMGHENVGRIHTIGSIAVERWGLREGDRVALEEYLPCLHCSFCRSGEYRLCEQTESRRPGALRYGTTPISQAPGLWGGYSQYQYLHPNSVFHRVAEDVPAELAAMCLPIGNGIQWAYLDGGAGPGMTVLIQGPGQQGLACVVAAKLAGADRIIVTGLSRDQPRLDVAVALGADQVVLADRQSLPENVADICIDTAGGPATLNEAIRAVKKNGKVLFAAAPKSMHPDFHVRDLLARRITLKPCRGHSYQSVEMALRLIASGRFPLHLMATHRFGLTDVDLALRSTGGEGAEGAVHVTVMPWENER